MADGQTDERRPDARKMLLESLLRKVDEDNYPSTSMLDMIELLLRPNELPLYVAILLRHIDREQYPSIPIMRRLVDLAG